MSLSDQETMMLYITKKEVDIFAACLGIGILMCIKEKVLPPNVGIWTMAMPKIWQPLEEIGISPAMLDVFQEFDELKALSDWVPQELDNSLEQLISVLLSEIRKREGVYWQMEWEDESKN